MDPIWSVPITAEKPAIEHKTKNIFLWALQVVGLVVFSIVGVSKIVGTDTEVQLFKTIGWGDWFRYFTGSLEIAGALTLLFLSTVRIGAFLLMGVMAGAAATHIAILHTNPALPLSLMVLLGIILWGRCKKSAGHGGAELD